MLALCLMLLVTYYALNYASKIGQGLGIRHTRNNYGNANIQLNSFWARTQLMACTPRFESELKDAFIAFLVYSMASVLHSSVLTTENIVFTTIEQFHI